VTALFAVAGSGERGILLPIAYAWGIWSNVWVAPKASEVPSVRPSPPEPRPTLGVPMVVGLVTLVGMGLAGYGVFTSLGRRTASESVRPTPAILMSVRDLSRLETTEMHIEKVVDLTDKQSRFFGLVETHDALLLVASGDVTVGIDLGKLKEEDVVVDRATGSAKLFLPEPEVFSTRLDEGHTYVYKRSTDVLAQRNEALESRARQEAVRSIEKAARETDVMERAKRQAERQLGVLLERMGVVRAEIQWRSPS
jgi:hypothetical protein